MNPLTIHAGTAHDLLQALLVCWIGIEVLLRLYNREGKTASDWTYWLVMASFIAGFNLGFRVAHLQTAVFGGDWVPVIAGCAVLGVGIGLRTWAIMTLGRFFKFVVVIQEDHCVITSGPYRFLRHPSYTGALVGFLGVGIALDNWLSILTLVVVPSVAIFVRIHVEEGRLAEALGTEYEDYSSRTRSRLIPGLW
jgi:protein-S-isoprenylcysteine O-methyltransferase Ste14